MLQRVRIADRFKAQSAEQLVTMAGAVITGLTNNPAFPAPTVDLKAVQAAADDLNAALAVQTHEGTAATAEKNNKHEALITVLLKLKHYVEDNCGNDLAVLLSSGFQAAATTRNRSPLANPSILSVDLGNSTELVLKTTPIAREVLRSADGSGGRRLVHLLAHNDHRPRSGNNLYVPGARRRRIQRLCRLEQSGVPHVRVGPVDVARRQEG
jgi:hypothetical protein